MQSVGRRLWRGSPTMQDLAAGCWKLGAGSLWSFLQEASMRWIVLFLLFVGACSSETKPDRLATQRQRDSVLGASKLPGARGVRGALAAQDSAVARNARLDSVSR
jgi:hypothetical protein